MMFAHQKSAARPGTWPARRPARRGTAFIVAIVMLTMFTALASAFIYQGSLSVAKGDNYRQATDARMVAESGMAWMLQRLKEVRIPESDNLNTLAISLQGSLASRLNGTGNLGTQTVTVTGPVVKVPTVTLKPGQTFDCTFTWLYPTVCRVLVTGRCGDAVRQVSMNLEMIVKRSGAFDYGLASRGAISVYGNARLIGVNTPGEANILSVTTSAATAIRVDGSSRISGDLSVAGGSSAISISGSPVVGNTGDPRLWASHCHFNVEPPDFPVYNTAPLAALATTTIDATTPLAAKTTLTNVRIKAGTNPTFNNQMTLNGIIYVEAPNVVRFEGQANINGFIVTQEAAPGQLATSQIHFAGGVEARGVDALPATAEFAAVKQQRGSFIVAPGFGVTFAGNVNAVNGNIAASQLTFTGTATGTVRGSLIGLKDLPSSLGGTVDIYVDRTNAEQNPTGFVKTYALKANPTSYAEITGE